jgi:hypothetical protein
MVPACVELHQGGRLISTLGCRAHRGGGEAIIYPSQRAGQGQARLWGCKHLGVSRQAM